MYHNYCKSLINNKGILNINNLEIRKRIRSFVTISKHTENAGIELADYIAFYLIKSLFIDTDQKSDIIKTMEKKLYNGGFKVIEKDVRNYFGLRQIPFDYEELKRKNAEIHTLKNRLRNIKREKNKLIKKVDVLIKEKRELEYTIKELEKKQKNLNNT